MTSRAQNRRTPAPSGLRPEEVALLIEELEPVLVGARFEKALDYFPDIPPDSRSDAVRPPRGAPDPHGIVLRFNAREPKRLHLLLSTRPGFSRFHVIDVEGPAPPHPTDSIMVLRDLLRGATVTGVDQPGGDRILRLRLRQRRDDKIIERSLVLELFGRGGRLVLFESESRKIRWVAGRTGLTVGDQYRFPTAQPKRENATLAPPFRPELLIPAEDRGEPLAFHRALGPRMNVAEERATFDDARDELERRVRTESKRRRKLLTKLESDAQEADQWEENQRIGELLKGELHRLERGMSNVTLVDYFDPELAERVVTLDPLATPPQNVERYFKRARKRKRAIPMVEARRAECDADLARLESAGAALEQATTVEDLEAVRTKLSGLKIREQSKKQGRGKKKIERRRRYHSREGLEILVGRNSRENDRLSISVARGNDLFFHRADRPGAHVILRLAGKPASPESIEDAAFLAAYFSGWRGPEKARVHYTYAKYVRKPKGLPPGKVLISREREYWIEYRPELLERIVAE